MKEFKLYKCNICGNLLYTVEDSGVVQLCCGQDMEEIYPNTVDAAQEKHVPVIDRCGNDVLVNVGSDNHPMTDKHYIEWIVLVTDSGMHVKELNPEDSPRAFFRLCLEEKIEAAYAYCNIHGLWKKEISK